MQIDHIHIRNFRKLKNCRIDFDEDQTIFVGANNSGKTSAISAVLWFLKYKDRFTTREFTLPNWSDINALAAEWLEMDSADTSLLNNEKWDSLIPSLDIWIRADETEAHRVYKLIPSLNWRKDLVGVRLRLEPTDLATLYGDYKKEYLKAQKVKSTEEYIKTGEIELYPCDMLDFLKHGNNLKKYFSIKYYVLDSEKIPTVDADIIVQDTPLISLNENPLDDLIRIDSIEAFREFSDPEGRLDNDIDTLSKQLQKYYRNNAEEDEVISIEDLALLKELANANNSFDTKLNSCFASPIKELGNINYPGFQNPAISIKSKVNILDAISHESAVQFTIHDKLSLPEKYNGLGLRNLISIYLKLIQFREDWTKTDYDDQPLKPIHLVFIEEPEAHLHAQAQQVFIRKALEALTNTDANTVLKNNKNLKTQLVVSTHSNHIVNEINMKCLRYFKRVVDTDLSIPVSQVVNLCRTFGKTEKDNQMFVTRYIRLTHCDIFFADAVIIVEGAAERILLPHFLKLEHAENHYISIIEINGSHAHRFKALLEKLDIHTLIITDIDAQEEYVADNGKKQMRPTLPVLGKNQTTNNDSIKIWLNESSVDNLLKLSSDQKRIGKIYLAFQTGINVLWDKDYVGIVYPYTFEDALTFTNLDLFRNDSGLKRLGTATTFHNYLKTSDSIIGFHKKLFNALERSSTKAEFATTILFANEFENLKVPEYIQEGLIWIKNCLQTNSIKTHVE